jgi:hypothetical protein
MKDDRPIHAFPWCGDLNETPFINLGMSLRDYLAAKAMQGICTHADTWGCGIEEIGMRAYEVADAMLRARDA